MSNVVVNNALLSVSDKSGLVAFGRELEKFGVQLMSTGGTQSLLEAEGLSVQSVSDYTGFPEMMDGRVKTLHPMVHGGLLGRTNPGDGGLDAAVMDQHGIRAIDLLVVNLYPFEQTIADPKTDFDCAIENIDIGGPAMLRSAAKNFERVAVVVDAADYADIATEMATNNGTLSRETRFRLAVKAFAHVAKYDAAISNYLGGVDLESTLNSVKFPEVITRQYVKKQEMRYGENPHQGGSFYIDDQLPQAMTVGAAVQVQGKALSYNNVADTDAALECVKAFSNPACVIVKHANPCGVAENDDLFCAYKLAFAADKTSAFGGIVAFNRPLTQAIAEQITADVFVEVVIAPGIDAGAVTTFKKKKNVRLLDCSSGAAPTQTGFDFKRVSGGLLVQDQDIALLEEAALKTVTEIEPTDDQKSDLLFAWKVAKYVKSNAIVYARNRQTIGIGAGQMSRIYSAIIAGIKADDEGFVVAGSVMASDAFFPFRDSIDAAAEAGITAIVQPGGSIKDEEVISAANEAGIAMMFTGMRHFRH